MIDTNENNDPNNTKQSKWKNTFKRVSKILRQYKNVIEMPEREKRWNRIKL